MPPLEMGKEFKIKQKGYNFEELKNEALLSKLVKIEEDHKKSFKDSVNSLRQYYLDYLEQTNFKDLSEEDLIKKSILFRSSLMSPRKTSCAETEETAGIKRTGIAPKHPQIRVCRFVQCQSGQQAAQ